MEEYSTINKLIDYIKKEKYKGYDPYDTLNSWFPFKIFGHLGQRIALQFQVRNPVNIRPLLGVKKEYSAKGLALILQAYSVLYRIKPSEDLKNEMDFLFNWFLNNRVDGYSGYCWTVHYPLAWGGWKRPKIDPSAVLAAVVVEGVFEYYLSTKNEKAIDLIIGVTDFLKTHIPITENENGKCYSYTTRKKEVVFNANMYVAEVFSKAYYLTENNYFKEEALKCLDFNIAYQENDGRWAYRLDMETGQKRNQIDFHQGFILNSLNEIIKYLNLKEDKYTNSLTKGLKYYQEKQFTDDGKAFWRVPALYPIDIHNQAVGIMILSKLHNVSDTALKQAETILNWTNNNLYNNKKGYYYYQKRKLFTNKISYIRWNQAWMLLGLVYHYQAKTKKDGK